MLSILGVLLCLIAGIAKAVQDKLAHHFSTSIFSDKGKYNALFWNPKISWMNKYDYDPTTGKLDTSKEKFLGSTTMFVALTDAWHLFQLLHINMLIVGVFIIGTQVDYYALVLGVVLYRVVFEVNYRWILKI